MKSVLSRVFAVVSLCISIQTLPLINYAEASYLPAKTVTGDIPNPYDKVTRKEVSGPLKPETGGIIDGVHVTSTTGSCIIIQPGRHDITIKNSEIGPCTDPNDPNGAHTAGILGNGSPNANGPAPVYNIHINHNIIHDVPTAVHFVNSFHPIYFDHNYVYNLQIGTKNPNGSYPRGNMIQFSNVVLSPPAGWNGPDNKPVTAGSKITCNISDEQGNPLAKYIGDHISIYNSKGLPSAPTEIAYNRIRGGDMKSASGIQSTDGGGGYEWVHHNSIINVGDAGTGILGGVNSIVENNIVYGDSVTTHTGLGMYLRNYYTTGTYQFPDGSKQSVCSGNIIRNNRVFSINSMWYTTPVEQNFWNDNLCTNSTVTGNVFGDKTLNAAMFDTPYSNCSVSLTFTSSSASVPYNTPVKLTWSSVNVPQTSSCTASGDWSGSFPPSGSYTTPNLKSKKTYTLTCTGSDGSATHTVAQTVKISLSRRPQR